MYKICKRYVQDIDKICTRYEQDMYLRLCFIILYI